ncbi:MAG: ArsR family transcriptional regulator [Cytophagales bacterium]|nr:ArsR family transcriptional regulator [Cytophagales bacterium]
MITTLITSKTRIKLLLKFFLNPENSAHLRGLESEFGESSNAIRMELNRFEEADMLHSVQQGNRKLFKVNDQHPLYGEINSIVRKYFGLDVIVEWIAKRLGNLKAVYLTGDISKGKDVALIDLILVGDIDQPYLLQLIEKAEKLIKRKIRYLIYSESEFKNSTESKDDYLLVWGNGEQ